MALRDLVIRSQLIPPRPRRGVLRRPRLEARLAEALDYPVTLVQAGTGYGKSTALAALADHVADFYWYTITEPDRDPLLFLAHLVCAFEGEDADWCEPALTAVPSLDASNPTVLPTTGGESLMGFYLAAILGLGLALVTGGLILRSRAVRVSAK